MTKFTAPLKVGSTGSGLNGTEGLVETIYEMTVSANGLSRTIQLDTNNNAILTPLTFITETSAEGIAAGIDLLLGDSVDQDKFAVAVVSGLGSVDMTVSAVSLVSAGSEIILEATAQASGADLTAFQGRLYLRVLSRGNLGD